ncbi:MAG: arsenate reductase ArsC [candidate division Zixibacteria bacterium]|nr:arsenate reductase ArsC [candidate division Zixibacteria bacterium]
MKPKILFVCIENSCRSQMAEGFAKFYGEDRVEVFSAGSNPSGKVDQIAIEVMKEKGIDISNQKSKGFKELPFNDFDYVITMGCGDVCPFVPAKERIEWEIEDPKGKAKEKFREVRDKIEKNIKEFLSKLKQS